MQVRVIREFFDLQHNKRLRKVNELYDAPLKRANDLQQQGFVVKQYKKKPKANGS